MTTHSVSAPTATWTPLEDGSWVPATPSPQPLPAPSAVIFGSVGAPPASLAFRAGLYYFRSDTPGTANQRIYVSTAVGVWSGVV